MAAGLPVGPPPRLRLAAADCPLLLLLLLQLLLLPSRHWQIAGLLPRAGLRRPRQHTPLLPNPSALRKAH